MARAELARGKMFVRSGELERGAKQLRRTREEFLRQGMIEEAGLCALLIVEALLARGATAEAERLARRVVSEFTVAHLNTRAITALGYLTESIAERKASATTAENVRNYICSLRRQPNREFVATA